MKNLVKLSGTVVLSLLAGCSLPGRYCEPFKERIVTEYFNPKLRVYHVKDKVDTLYFDEEPFGSLDKVRIWDCNGVKESKFILKDSSDFPKLEKRYMEIIKEKE